MTLINADAFMTSLRDLYLRMEKNKDGGYYIKIFYLPSRQTPTRGMWA